MSRNKRICMLVIPVVICAAAFARAESAYDAQNRRDPLIPLVSADGRFQRLEPVETGTEKKEQALKVDGIVYDTMDLSYAIVNNDVVKVGDSIEGYHVLKIETDKVVFIREGQLTEVSLNKEGS